jgi:hypothetical protein
VFKVETIGDAYMIACGHDCSTHDHALRMAAAAVDMLAATDEIRRQIGSTVQIRIGMHTGTHSCLFGAARVLPLLCGWKAASVGRSKMLHALAMVCADALSAECSYRVTHHSSDIQANTSKATTSLLQLMYLQECMHSMFASVL